jgi:hypothetical protein
MSTSKYLHALLLFLFWSQLFRRYNKIILHILFNTLWQLLDFLEQICENVFMHYHSFARGLWKIHTLKVSHTRISFQFYITNQMHGDLWGNCMQTGVRQNMLWRMKLNASGLKAQVNWDLNPDAHKCGTGLLITALLIKLVIGCIRICTSLLILA